MANNTIDGNNIYILGDFDDSISNEIIPKLIDFVKKHKNVSGSELNIYINSNGGRSSELRGLLTILDEAKKYKIKINTKVIGDAYSCGSMLAVYGDHRTMSRRSHQLVHSGFGGFFASTQEQADRGKRHIDSHFKFPLEHYMEYTKIPKDKLKEALSDDMFYIDSKTCLKWGLCDEIV